jgi:hypothetical protein|tara:strand:- start:1617 stop:1823 length:207 start_codon:yes stop_codon:yes gene_type:complete
VEGEKMVSRIEQLQSLIRELMPRAEILEDKFGSVVIDTMLDVTTDGNLISRDDNDAMSVSSEFDCIEI